MDGHKSVVCFHLAVEGRAANLLLQGLLPQSVKLQLNMLIISIIVGFQCHRFAKMSYSVRLKCLTISIGKFTLVAERTNISCLA